VVGRGSGEGGNPFVTDDSEGSDSGTPFPFCDWIGASSVVGSSKGRKVRGECW